MRLPELDGLRGLAAMTVVFAHFSSHAGGGYLIPWLHWFSAANIAVVFFFGLSAFLLAHNAEKQFDARSFLTNRALRICPLYFTVVIVTIAIVSLPPYFFRWEQLDGTITNPWAVMAFYVNWPMANGRGPLNEFSHLWSLAVEMQFYILFAIAFPYLRKIKPWIVCTTALALGMLCRYLTLDLPYPYFSSLSYIEVFVFCGVAGVLTARGKRIQVSTSICLLALLVAGLGWRRVLWTDSAQASVLYPFIAALIALVLQNARQGFLRHKGLVFLGVISYGIYLWHLPVKLFLFPIERYVNKYLAFGIYVLSTIAVAWLTYKLIERPVSIWRGRYFKHGPLPTAA